jgi:hypothetical protein
MPVLKPIPATRRGQTRGRFRLAVTGLLAGMTIALAPPARSAADPVLVAPAQAVDQAWALLDERPLSVQKLVIAEDLLRRADQAIGPALGTAFPGQWAQDRGLNTLLVIELFNRFNEVSDLADDARSFDNRVVWAADTYTRGYLAKKSERLAAAKKALPPDRYRLYLAGGKDGEPASAVTRPWTVRSGPRYGFDVGRFRRETRLDLKADGTVAIERHVTPAPWMPEGPNPPNRMKVMPSPSPAKKAR